MCLVWNEKMHQTSVDISPEVASSAAHQGSTISKPASFMAETEKEGLKPEIVSTQKHLPPSKC